MTFRRLIEDFVQAAKRAQRAGFAFVDVKHCHGYLGHEFLSSVDRPGRYGGSFENRTRFLREVAAGIRAEAPGLAIGVRVSAMDWLPFRPGPTASASRSRSQAAIPTPSAATAPVSVTTWRSRGRSLICCGRWASGWCASRWAVRTTTRTFSGRRCFRRRMAINRRKTR